MPDQPLAGRPVDFVKKVGRGRTLSQDLTPQEARLAFSALLDGAFAPAQAGAFLQALRIKELTQDELDGMMAVLYARMAGAGPRPPLRGRRTLALNFASDTGRKGGLVSLLAARILPRFGVGVGIIRSTPMLSGNRKSFAESWALGDLGEAPAVRPAGDEGAPPPVIVDCGDLIPGLSALDELRGQLGFRSCLHTAEKLLNPWQDAPMLLGISHKHYALRMAEAMRTLGLAGKIVLGNHGTVDLVLHKETEMVAVDVNGIREETVSPAELGLAPGTDIYSLAKFPQWKEWLLPQAGASPAGPGPASGPSGPRDSGLWQALLFHLAVFLWASGAAPDPEAGLAEARRGLAEAV